MAFIGLPRPLNHLPCVGALKQINPHSFWSESGKLMHIKLRITVRKI